MSPTEYQMWESKFAIATSGQLPPQLDLVLGDSRSLAGINPNLIHEDLYNLSLGGATPIEMYLLLEKIINKAKIKRAFLIFAPHHLKNSDIFWDRTLLFNIFPLEDYISMYKVMNKNNFFPRAEFMEGSFTANYLEYMLGSPRVYNFAFKKKIDSELVAEKRLWTKSMIEKTRGWHPFGTKESAEGNSPESNIDLFIPKPVNRYYLFKIIDMLSKRNIETVITFVPLNRIAYTNLRASYKLQFQDYMKEIHQEYPKVIIDSKLFYYDKKFFGDPDHLNERGAKEYSAYFKKKFYE